MTQRIEFVKPWRFYHVGDVIEPPGVLRQHLLNGVAKPAKPGALLTMQGVVSEKVPMPAEAALADPLEDTDDDVSEIETTVAPKRRRRNKDVQSEQQDLD